MLKAISSLIMAAFFVAPMAWADFYDLNELNEYVEVINNDFKMNAQNVELKFVEGSNSLEKAQIDLQFLSTKTVQIRLIIPTNASVFEKARITNLAMSLAYGQFGNALQLIEIISNAKAGDLASQHDLLLADKNIKITMLKHVRNEAHDTLFVDNFSLDAEAQKKLENEIKADEQALKELGLQITKQNRENLAMRSSNIILEALESQDLKLNDLILNNDRHGVRKMLEAYLPISLMNPSEKKFWTQWLEAIEHPNFTDSVIGFRGIDSRNDKVQVREVNGETRYGLMSTMLTRNQGSYTRRLRSLVTARERLNTNNLNEIGYRSMGIMAAARRHAGNPIGSTFLSLSVSVPMALSFAQNGIAMVRVDRRRALFNGTNNFTSEKEVLIPLIIFPDEVIFLRQWPTEKTSLQRQSGLDQFNEFIENPEFKDSVLDSFNQFGDHAYKSLLLFKPTQNKALSSNKMCRALFN